MHHFITRVLLITVLAGVFAVSGCRADEHGDTGTIAPRITNHGTGPDYAGYCLTCHGPGNGPQEFPPDHAGRTNDMCLTCHHS